MKKLICILFYLLICACNTHQPLPQDTLVVGIEKSPENFDPRLPKDAISQKINKLVYDGLLAKDTNLNLVPSIAKSYSIVESKKYIFKLRDDILFHNYKKLTSADVKATYISMMGNKINSPYKSNLQIIESIETPDAQTIIFSLKEIFTPFLTMMSLGILPEEYIKQDGENEDSKKIQLQGTGPYKFILSENKTHKIKLERFDHHFAGPAKSKNIIFRTIEDSTLRTLELLKGRIDIIQNNIPYVMIPFLKEKKHISFKTNAGINFAYMAFNFNNKYLREKKIRKAISLAIDRKKIITYKLADMGIKATSLLSPTHWAHNAELRELEYNPELAKKLLDETKFKDPDGDGPLPRFNLTYKTSSIKERIEIAELIAEGLNQIGINVTVMPYEFGTFYRDIRQGDFDIYTLTWVGLSDPDIYYEIFHSSKVPPKGSNRGFYNNKTLDTLLNQSRLESDPIRLKDLYYRIQQIAYVDFVYAPLWYETNFVFMRDVVKNYDLRPDANFISLTEAYKTE